MKRVTRSRQVYKTVHWWHVQATQPDHAIQFGILEKIKRKRNERVSCRFTNCTIALYCGLPMDHNDLLDARTIAVACTEALMVVVDHEITKALRVRRQCKQSLSA